MIDTTPFDDKSRSNADRESFKVLSKTILRKILLGGVTKDLDGQANQYQSPPLGAYEIAE